MSSPLDRIAAVAEAAELLRALGSPAARALGEDLAGWLADGAAVPLDAALGLRRRGGVSPRRALAIADRDGIVRRLAAVHPEWSALEPSIAARRMRQAFDRYEAGRWPRERDSLAAPSAEPAASFWRILRGGAPMPRVDRLRQIIGREIESPV